MGLTPNGRAPAFEAGMWGFESLQTYSLHSYRTVLLTR
jgi:hypothetical protein